MLRLAFRRLLWVFPSVLGVSLVAFFLLSLVPPPRSLAMVDGADEAASAARRERFLDLPLLFNVDPSDVRARVSEAVERLVASSPGSDEENAATRELTRLGGAGLPILLPRLDELAPEQRRRVALALAPLAERMGIDSDDKARDPTQVVVFWNRYWETRGVEFQTTTARSAVRRFKRYGTEARADQLRSLDTYALPVLIDELEDPSDAEAHRQLRRVVIALSQVTGRRDVFTPEASAAAARACMQRWQRWWLVHEADYQPLVGAERVAAFVLQTRYGKWVYETLVMRMGKDDQGAPVLELLLERARLTVSILLFGFALAYALALPLGAVAAWHRGRGADHAVAALVLVPYVASPAVLALVAVRMGAPLSSPMLVAGLVLALVLLADPVRHQRAALVPVLTEDYVRAATARGAGPVRVTLVHALRNAMLPLATRASLELPLVVTSCFVIEKVLGLPGLGEATLDAVLRHDTSWLMALALSGSVIAVASLVISDVAYALLDPRLRSALMTTRRRGA
jgi:ABC-type dipeptide/oligopeptide/nickel transport system permease component